MSQMLCPPRLIWDGLDEPVAWPVAQVDLAGSLALTKQREEGETIRALRQEIKSMSPTPPDRFSSYEDAVAALTGTERREPDV